MNEHIHLRAARESDAAFLQEVYRYYIDNTEASYNDRAKPVAAYAESIRELSKQYPFLIAEDETRQASLVLPMPSPSVPRAATGTPPS